ncbi:methyl-accepting chemotaxis protein [Deltaproteobacteria bacterium TL4]
MKTFNQIKITTKVTGGFVIIILLMVLSSIHRIHSSLNDAAHAKEINENLLPQALTFIGLRMDVVQIQQWLTDIAATQAQGGMDAGYGQAEQYYQEAHAKIAKLMETHRQDKEITKYLKSLKRDLDSYYEMGKVMAKAYIEGGPGAGNTAMAKFDPLAQKITSSLSNFVGEYNAKLTHSSSEVEASANFSVKAGLLSSIAIFILSALIAFMISRNISRLINKLVQKIREIIDGEINLTKSFEVNSYANCSDIRGCHNQACSSFGKEEDCWSKVGSMQKEKNKIKCPRVLKGNILNCSDCQVFQMAEVNEIASISIWLNAFITQVKQVVEVVKSSADHQSFATKALADSSLEISASTKNIQQRISGISSASHQVSSSIQKMTSSSEFVASNINTVAVAVEQLNTNITTIAGATEESSVNMVEISQNTSRISVDIEKLANVIEGMSKKLAEISRNTQEAMSISTDANQTAQVTLNTMTLLGETANKIGKIVKLIDNIASQTNMLALNATIEAASAGDAGKGFAVVASEVKDLAQQTADANNEIAQQIELIQKQTTEALNHSRKINDLTTRVAEINRSTNKTIDEQSKSSAEISRSVDSIANASKETALNVDEANLGMKEIARSIAEASQVAHDTSQRVAQNAGSMKEIARASSESALGVQEVNANLQEIQSAIGGMDEGVLLITQNAMTLKEMSEKLREITQSFITDKKTKASTTKSLMKLT